MVEEDMAQLDRKIQYTPQDVAKMTADQQWMAAEVTQDINAMVYYSHEMTPEQVVEVLDFLRALLGGK